MSLRAKIPFYFSGESRRLCKRRPKGARPSGSLRAPRGLERLTLEDPHQHQRGSQARLQLHGATSTGCSGARLLLESWPRTLWAPGLQVASQRSQRGSGLSSAHRQSAPHMAPRAPLLSAALRRARASLACLSPGSCVAPSKCVAPPRAAASSTCARVAPWRPLASKRPPLRVAGAGSQLDTAAWLPLWAMMSVHRRQQRATCCVKALARTRGGWMDGDKAVFNANNAGK